MSGTQRALIGIAIAVTFCALRGPFLDLPLERDEGEYAYIAQRWQAGDIPYETTFDQKPPGVFVAYRLAFATLGDTPRAIHGFAQVWNAATLVVLFFAGRRLMGETAAAWAAWVFAVASADPRLTATAANTELFMLLPWVASLAWLLRARDHGRWLDWFLCGAAVSAACWIKPVAAVQVPLVLTYAIARPERWRAAGALGFGMVAASLPFLVYFAAHGALGALVDAALLHNLRYAQNFPAEIGLRKLLGFLSHWLGTVGVAALLAVFGAMATLREPRLRVLPFWLAISAAGTSIGLYFRPHYFIQCVPALSALAGWSLAYGVSRISRESVRTATTCVAALVVAAPHVIGNLPLYRGASPGETSRAIYGMNPFPESELIAAHVARRSTPDETVYIVGSEPQILFHAERVSATRYIFFYPLTGDFPDALERQRTALREVRASQPRYVVWVNLPTSLLVEPGLWSAPAESFIFSASIELVRKGYAIDAALVPESRTQYEWLEGADAQRWFRSRGGSPLREPGIYLFRKRDRGAQIGTR